MPIYKATGKKDGLQKYNIRINYMHNGDSKQLTRTAYGFEAAKDLERKLTDEVKNPETQPVKKMTVQQLYDKYIKAKQYEVRETTLDRYKQNYDYFVMPTFKNARIDKITPPMLEKWKLSMEEKDLSLSTKRQAFNAFRALFVYAIKMEYYFAKNPVSKMGNFKNNSEVKKEMDFYTVDEFIQFINKAKLQAEERQKKYRDLSEWDFYVFFNIAFYTGLRKGEIYGLTWNDIDGSYLSVKRSISQRLKGDDRILPPKNKASYRTLQMPLPLIQILKEHKKRQSHLENFKDSDIICGGKRSIRDTTLQRRSKQYATTAGIKTIRIHDFRHSHVSVLANENINI